MISLRKMVLEDLPIFKKWLFTPHVAKWYHNPSDWIDEIEKQDGDFSWIHHFIVEFEGKPIGFCCIMPVLTAMSFGRVIQPKEAHTA